ncbi:MAG: hypothetical protein A2X13_14605 [Bacteroidetes bacterium GWC2_33_15]|nr:MAG: hypothetical protein A2X10_12650 [Bacteroidetes bacterium GWA2_33_15]OFX50103.1 MAG: hypothetical protein A2X13_14605 [Bacteroidetes bacterium GWC2_33_15]OFX65256.1 MAG: hypothetical protein A2X15_04180 [Bacteroidetes bacterium GWB2_32_14]OFX70482.1 MAG: hypothetical protein A2X14_04235 [Bacteroidetes bacterium GWD2_33_33]HAN19645.1 hypothetical protein [Bacteroidales bacterium]
MDTQTRHPFLIHKLSPLAAIGLLLPTFVIEKEDPDFFNFDAIYSDEIEFDLLQIVELVCESTSIPIEEMIKISRKREIVYSRQLAMVMALLYTRFSTTVIGNQLGGKDHATVLHAKKTIIDLYDTDFKIKTQVDNLITHLNFLTKSNMSVNILRKKIIGR